MSKSSSWGEWFEDARIKTKEFAEKAQVIAVAATKIAQDGAIELGKQAHELREKYDLDLATSALISTIGGRPADSSSSYRQRASNNPGQQRKSVLDLVYITENLISMSFPYDFKKNGRRNGEDGNDISIVSKFLKQKHGSHFMIWNVSENSYDYSYFGDQVLEYSFPGHPAPPLGLLFNICTSVESWLDADEKNVAVLHCLTGRGRTAALMSCILTWIGEFTSPVEALQYVAERRGVSVDYLTIPSQRRYVQYFTSMLTGNKPLPAAVRMVRIILNTIPDFSENGRNGGCCPYVQIFQNGRLIATATPIGDGKESVGGKLSLKRVRPEDGSVSFVLDCTVQGDLLLRCRHVDPAGGRISIFRAAFHTGYIPASGVLRFLKSDLDGACSDAKFSDQFFIDLMFSPVDSSGRKKGNEISSGSDLSRRPLPLSLSVEETKRNVGVSGDMDSNHVISRSEEGSGVQLISMPTEEIKDAEIEAERVDGDALLWDAVAAKISKSKKKKSRKYFLHQKDHFSITDELGRSRSADSTDGGHMAPIVPSVSNEELIMQIARLELDEGKAEQKSGLEGKEGENEVGANENTGNLQNAENIESSENEIGGEESEEYDEDYYVSMDDIYHQETEFVNVNELMLSGNENPLSSFQSRGNPSHTGAKIPMTSSEFEVVKKNNLSGKEVSDEDKRHKDGIIKVDDESDGTDDFLRFLESTSTNKSKSDSVSASISQDINRKENEGIQDSKSIDGDSGMFSVDSGSAGIKTGTDPLSFTAVQNTTDRNATDSKTTSQDTNKIVKKSGDDIDELDELERYLLNLNG